MSALQIAQSVTGTARRLGRPSIYGILLLVVAGFGIAFLATRFGVDTRDVWRHVRHANPLLLLMALGLFYAGLFIRGWRWRVIMENASSGGSESPRVPSAAACAQYVLIARFVDSVAWLRFGNIYRAYLASSDQPARIPHVLGTIVSEHILDVAVIFAAALAVGAFIVVRGATIPVAQPVVAGGLTVAVLCLGLLTMWRYGVRFSRRLPRPLARAYLRLHRGVLHGLRARRMPLLLILSAAGWILAVARWYLVIAALGASASFPLVLFLSITNVLVASVPLTPGGLGLVEPGATAVLAIELPLELAVAITLAERAISYVSVIVAGAVTLASREFARRARVRVALRP